jgi:hypothetical protein
VSGRRGSSWLPSRRALPSVIPPLAVAAVAAPYLLLLKSPLRLAGDEITYLSLGARMVDSSFPLPPDIPIHYPRGYPALIAALDKIGLGVPWAFVLLNLVMLAIGLAASFAVLRRGLGLEAPWAWLVVGLVLLSRVVVWTTGNALSDLTFLAVAMTAVLLLVESRHRRAVTAWTMIGAATALFVCALQVRTIGVALVPPLVFACLVRSELRGVRRAAARRPALAVGLAVLAAACAAGVAVAAIGGTGYASATATGWHVDGASDVPRLVVHRIAGELKTLGALVINVRAARASGVPAGLYLAAGLIALAIAAYGIWTRRRQLEACDVFAGSVALILFVWPGDDARLWLPAAPLLGGYVAVVIRRYVRLRVVQVTALVCAATFAVFGAVTLARSVRIALSGSDFPAAWAGTAPLTRPTYEFAFFGTPVDRRRLKLPILRLLRRYEPRAKHPAGSVTSRAPGPRSGRTAAGPHPPPAWSRAPASRGRLAPRGTAGSAPATPRRRRCTSPGRTARRCGG